MAAIIATTPERGAVNLASRYAIPENPADGQTPKTTEPAETWYAERGSRSVRIRQLQTKTV